MYSQPMYSPFMPQNYGQFAVNRMNYSQPQQQPINNFEVVNNRESAEAYYIPPNSKVILMDKELPRIYLKETDAAGGPQVTTYSITKIDSEIPQSKVDYVTREEFEEWKRSFNNESISTTDESESKPTKLKTGQSDVKTNTDASTQF